MSATEGQSGSRPQKIFIVPEYQTGDLASVAQAVGIEVERVPAKVLSGITQEARDGFAVSVSGAKVQ